MTHIHLVTVMTLGGRRKEEGGRRRCKNIKSDAREFPETDTPTGLETRGEIQPQ